MIDLWDFCFILSVWYEWFGKARAELRGVLCALVLEPRMFLDLWSASMLARLALQADTARNWYQNGKGRITHHTKDIFATFDVQVRYDMISFEFIWYHYIINHSILLLEHSQDVKDSRALPRSWHPSRQGGQQTLLRSMLQLRSTQTKNSTTYQSNR